MVSSYRSNRRAREFGNVFVLASPLLSLLIPELQFSPRAGPNPCFLAGSLETGGVPSHILGHAILKVQIPERGQARRWQPLEGTIPEKNY